MFGPILVTDDGLLFSVGSGGIDDTTSEPSVGSASLKFESDGDRIAATNLGTTDEGDWITPKAAAGSFNSQCTIRAHVDSSTGSGLGSGSQDTDEVLTSDRTWVVTQSGVGTSSATITFTLKRNGTTVATAQRTISATVNP